MKVHIRAFLSLYISVLSLADPIKRSPFNSTKPEGRITNGFAAQRYQFPFVVSYQAINDGHHLCGGSILAPNWILISAHCFVIKATEARIVAGLLNLGEENNVMDVQIVAVARQIVHPYYQGGGSATKHDIGMVRLFWNLRYSAAIKPIALPTANQEFYGYAWTSGWGYLSSANPVPTRTLQQAQMWIITTQKCISTLNEIAGTIGPLDASMICGQGTVNGTETICRGDSGGPLVQYGTLIGVSSWTLDPCGVYLAPSVFTKVSWYLDFIRTTMQS